MCCELVTFFLLETCDGNVRCACSKQAKGVKTQTTSGDEKAASTNSKKSAQDNDDKAAAGNGQPQQQEEDGDYVMNPQFPEMPASVPLTYTLTMHACLSASPEERPTFEQVRTLKPQNTPPCIAPVLCTTVGT